MNDLIVGNPVLVVIDMQRSGGLSFAEAGMTTMPGFEGRVARIRSMVDKGLTLEQVKAANPTQGYRARYGSDTGLWTTDLFVTAVYNSLRPARKS